MTIGRILVLALVAISAGACKDAAKVETKAEPPTTAPPTPIDAGAPVAKPRPVPPLPPIPTGLPTPPPRAAPVTAELVAWGAELFADDKTWAGRSCASCHQPKRGYASDAALDVTASGKTNLRHTPSLLNLAYARAFYWDGRADSIASLLPNHIRGQLGGQLPDEEATDALAAFVLTRYAGNAAWDRHEAGEVGAVSEAAVRGALVFNDRAGCAVCHPPPLYTDLGLHGSAVPPGVGPPDPAKRWKTPRLRAIATTPPYFHAGTSATLEAAVDIELSRSDVRLSLAERADLVAFLRAL